LPGVFFFNWLINLTPQVFVPLKNTISFYVVDGNSEHYKITWVQPYSYRAFQWTRQLGDLKVPKQKQTNYLS
jgi:hypothetical protein